MSVKRRSSALSIQEVQYLERLGAHIRALRQAHELGLDELADRAGLHRTHLWKIEKGQLNAGAISYVRLASQLGVAPGELFPAFPLPPDQALREPS